MRSVSALCLIVAITTPAGAKDFVDGWAVTFRQEVFTGDIVAVAYVSETTESIMKAQIRFQCDGDGRPTASFHPGGISFLTPEDVEFKLGPTVKKVSFKPTEVGKIGTVLAAGRTDSDMLSAAFDTPGASIPFRTRKQQGKFEGAGGKQAFAALLASCPRTDP